MTQQPPPGPGSPGGPPPGHWPPPVGAPQPGYWPSYPPAQPGPGQPPPATGPTPYPPTPSPYAWRQHLDQQHPHDRAVDYAQIHRVPSWHWWRPVVGLLMGPFMMLIALPLLWLPVVFVGVALEGHRDYGQGVQDALTLKSVTPTAMLYLNCTLASLTLVAMGFERWLHGLKPRWLTSVGPGVRWRFFLACLGVGLLAIAAQLVVGSLLPSGVDDPGGNQDVHVTGTVVASALVVLLTTPLQAIGEEYAFRGYLAQAFGGLFAGLGKDVRSRRRYADVAAVVLPATVFALAHGTQNAPLFFDRLFFGLIAGSLALAVGGLEAGIALHILNNLLAFGIAIATGTLTDALTISEATWWQIPLTLTQDGLYLVLVLLVARAMGVARTTRPPGSPGLGSQPAVV